MDEKILVLAHTEPDGSLAKAALDVIETARALGGSLAVGLVGEKVQPPRGVPTVYVVEGAEFAVYADISLGLHRDVVGDEPGMGSKP